MLLDVHDGPSGISGAWAQDLVTTWQAAHALVSGRSAYPWFGDHVDLPYSPPFVVLVSPMGLLPEAPALVVTTILSALLAALTLAAWDRARLWPLLVSAPMLSLLRDDKLQIAQELAAVSLLLWLARRERWFLAGMAAALALGRTPNGVPVICLVALAAWGHPERLLKALAGAAAILVPLAAVSFLWDPSWPADYARNLSGYSASGPLAIAYNLAGGLASAVAGPGARAVFAHAALAVLPGLCALAAVLIGWRNRGNPPDLDQGALALAISMLGAPLPALYAAVVALPAVLRLARRPGLGGLPWLVAALPWALVLGLTPVFLGPAWQPAYDEATILLAAIFLLSALPLLRPPPRPTHPRI